MEKKKEKQIVWMVRWAWNTGEGRDEKVLIFASGKKARLTFQDAVLAEMESDFYQGNIDNPFFKLTKWDTLDHSYFEFGDNEHYSIIRFHKVEVQE